MHKLLERQLHQFFGAAEVPPDEWRPFLDAVSAAYAAADHERTLLERSLGVTSQALLTRNGELQRELGGLRQAAQARQRNAAERADRAEHAADRAEHAADRAERAEHAAPAERRQPFEEHQHQVQKMEAIGRLAGGVAHDFNNLLTAISGYAALIDRALSDTGSRNPGGTPATPAPVLSHVAEIRRAADRAAALTHQLLAFSRQQVMRQDVLDLNALIAGVQPALRDALGDRIQLLLEPAAELRGVLADRAQIEQVLANLAANARQAMPAGGTLTISTVNAHLGGREGGGHFSVAAGDYVLLTVRDDGPGMDSETRARAFEPFFTTKPVGQGSGLGLSTVYGVVKQSGGYVWLDSAPAQGCAVHIYLPSAKSPAATLAATVESPATTTAPRSTVVLAEDEEAVRSLVAQVLAESGYHVLAAANAREALDICRGLSAVDLLLTDVVMPEVNGRELARQVTLLHPNTKVLFMSGYADHAIDDPRPGMAPSFLEKPFLPAVLVQRVREILGGAG